MFSHKEKLFELCKKLGEKVLTSHFPLVLDLLALSLRCCLIEEQRHKNSLLQVVPPELDCLCNEGS